MTSEQDDNVPSLPAGATIGGKYRLIKALGRGASGSVYEAEGPDGERVAIKTVWSVLDGGAASQRLSRFLRESRVASALVSPHIVPVIGGGVDEGHQVAFSVMPLLLGEDVAALIKRLGPLHPVTAVRIAVQAGRGLLVAHEAGVVHRDIKPGNLFLDTDSQEITVKICDFGVAKTAGSSLNITAPGTSLGSPLYMAPEQLLNAKTVDARADIWSLAMTLFEMLAGSPAFQGISTFSELVLSMSTRPMPLVQKAAPWVDASLAMVLHGALVRDPEARCPSVQAFLDALAPFAAGAPSLSPSVLRGVTPELRKHQSKVIDPPASWDRAVASLSETALGTAGQLGSGSKLGASQPVAGSAPQDLVGQALSGRYRLERLLGKGGMGAVFECVDLQDPQQKRYALKVILSADRDADTLRRFVREARAVREIRSEHVVQVFDADTDTERNIPYIVMELLTGDDLDQLVKQAGPLEPAAVCRVFVQACRGLAAAHAAGIVHRDIKPANIFLHRLPSGRVVAKLCDFGVAKQTSLDTAQTSELTQTGGMVGSPMYMSPEQAKSAKHVDHRTDIWSLALSLYQALSGQKPWTQSGSLGELILSICTADLTPLQDVAPWVPPGLADVIHRGSQREPEDRYAHVDLMADALESFAAPADQVTPAALTSLSESARNAVAPRATGLGASRTSGGVPRHPATPLPPLPPTRRSAGWLLPVGIFAGVAGIGITGVVALKASTTPAPAASVVHREVITVVSVSAPASAAPAPSAPSNRVSGKLLIKGTPTRLSVNGTPHDPPASGELALEGAPGDVFFIEIEAGRLKRGPEKITLSRDGSLSPPEIVVPGPTGLAPGLVPGAAGAPGKVAPGAAGAPGKPPDKPPVAPADPGTVKPRVEF